MFDVSSKSHFDSSAPKLIGAESADITPSSHHSHFQSKRAEYCVQRFQRLVSLPMLDLHQCAYRDFAQ